jgi:hypothetical protein
LLKYIEQLLADRDERVRLEREWRPETDDPTASG